MHRRAEEINETTKQWVRHRGLKLVFDHAEVVKCDISATANTLKSHDTPNLLSPSIPALRDDPKIVGRDDTKVVGDSVAKAVPIFWGQFA